MPIDKYSVAALAIYAGTAFTGTVFAAENYIDSINQSVTAKSSSIGYIETFKDSILDSETLASKAYTRLFHEVRLELDSYRNLKPEWDGYDAIPPNFSSISVAKILLRSIYAKELPLPRSMISPDGEVGLYWDWEGVFIDLGVDEDNCISFFSKDKHGKTLGSDELEGLELPGNLLALISSLSYRSNPESLVVAIPTLESKFQTPKTISEPMLGLFSDGLNSSHQDIWSAA